MTSQWLDQEEAPTHFPKPNFHQKSSSLFGGLLWIWSIWILVKPLHLRSMFSKLMRCTKNCHTYSRNWSIERAQFFTMTAPNHTLHNQCFKIWATKFCLTYHFHLTSLASQPTTTSPSISFDNFFWGGRKILPQLAGGRKCFPRVSQILTFMLQELTNLFIVGKIVLIVMDSILVNKDMLEPSYDLKSTVWNSNYLCTNLIFIRVLLMTSTKLTAWFS